MECLNGKMHDVKKAWLLCADSTASESVWHFYFMRTSLNHDKQLSFAIYLNY